VIIIRNVSLAANHHIRLISERSRNTEAWSNGCWKLLIIKILHTTKGAEKKWSKCSLSDIYWLSCYPKLTSVNRQNKPVKYVRSTYSDSMKAWTKSGLLAALFLALLFPFCFFTVVDLEAVQPKWNMFWNFISTPFLSLPTHALPYPPFYPSPPARPTSNPSYGRLPVIVANFPNPKSFWWGRL